MADKPITRRRILKIYNSLSVLSAYTFSKTRRIPAPTRRPIGTLKIGSHIGPNNVPNGLSFAENITPNVTKYAENTKGRKANGLSPPPASRYASQMAKKYKQG